MRPPESKWARLRGGKAAPKERQEEKDNKSRLPIGTKWRRLIKTN